MKLSAYHEGIVERSEDVSNSEVLIAIRDLVLQGGHLLDGLFSLSRSLSLRKQNNTTILHLFSFAIDGQSNRKTNHFFVSIHSQNLTIVEIKCRDKEGSKLVMNW